MSNGEVSTSQPIESEGVVLFDPNVALLVLGDIMLDGYASGAVERISPEAPVPVLKHMAHHEVAGGAANVAMNIAALGGTVHLVGLVGKDEEAERLCSILDHAGVKPRFIDVADRQTTSKVRILAGTHQMLRIDKEQTGPIDSQVENRLIEAATDLLPRVGAVILSDYRKGCLTDRVLSKVIERARALGVRIFVDPKRSDFSFYRGADFITPNRSELSLATGMACNDETGCRAAAHNAIQVAGASVLLTRSEQGMSFFSSEGDEVWLPTKAKEVFDVSGAGDTVVSVFAYAISSGAPTQLALKAANVAAGLVIARSGTATTTAVEIVGALQKEPHKILSDRAPAATVCSLDEALAIRASWKREGLIVGLTNGCFDLIHPGHISLLRQAAVHCDRLIVALNSDASVRRLKGPTRPTQNDDARRIVMASIRYVDIVVSFDEDTPLALIQTLVPDVLIKGADYAEHQIVGADVVLAADGKIVRADLEHGQSTTILVARSTLPTTAGE